MFLFLFSFFSFLAASVKFCSCGASAARLLSFVFVRQALDNCGDNTRRDNSDRPSPLMVSHLRQSPCAAVLVLCSLPD